MNNDTADLRATNGSGEAATVKRALLAVKMLQAKVDAFERARSEPIAVVGIGCRFPQASGPDEFWRLLARGVDTVGEIPADRWASAAYYDPDPDAPGKMSSRWGAFLGKVDEFEAEFFGIAPREAAAMDPQQRLLLEVCWEALEHAGQAPDALVGARVGVFLGISTIDYLHLQNVGGLAHISSFSGTGNAFSTAAGRISYVLGLEGPNIAVDTACSSSLVCVHLACQSLRARESDMVLVGGVNLMLSPATSIAVSKYHALSPDGRCKTFDAGANGFVRGEGCGIVVLKRLSDAVKNRDQILAVLRGTAINQDGRSSGLTAPNVLAQQSVIRAALDRAGVAAKDVSYVEAHGTGTSLGDPIEVAALSEVYGAPRADGGRCALASVKTNVGHLEAAAGIAGLIKAVLSLQHESIPAHLHFRRLNPRISLSDTRLYIPRESQSWARGTRRRIAAVSSFGLSGTNAHAIVEEAPPVTSAPAPDRAAHVFTLSARSDAALRRLAGDYARHVSDDVALGDLCFTANSGRARLPHRLALVARSTEELRLQLRRVHQGDAPARALRGPVARRSQPRVAFLFSGQGAQYPGMGQQLWETEPVFRRAIERCDAILRRSLGTSLIALLYPPAGSDGPLHETMFAAVATFAIEHALVELWRSWGVEPAVVAGHSVGEYAAAWTAGVLALEDALEIVVQRSQLMSDVREAGGMAVVHTSADRLDELLARHPRLAVAALNAPNNTVISGPLTSLREAIADLSAAGIVANPLKASHGFHSSLFDGILSPFESVVAGMRLSPPKTTYVSGLTGAVTGGELTSSSYWRRHVREPVKFADVVRTLRGEHCDAFVEIGPAPVLLALAERELRRREPAPASDESSLRADVACVGSLSNSRPGAEQMARAAGELFLNGIDIDWVAMDRDRARVRVPLPTYPFERRRHWFDAAPAAARVAEPGVNPLLGHALPVALDNEIFETELGVDALPFLADHRVYDRIVVPAAAHVALALMACGEVLHTAHPAVERVVFEEPLVLGEAESVKVQIVLTPAGTGRYAFRILSRGATAWRQHAAGELCAAQTSVPAPARLDDVRARLGAAHAPDAYYDQLREWGIDLRDRFRGITSISRGEGEVLGRIRLPERALDLGAKYLHPVLLDSTMQLLGAIVAGTSDDNQIYLPMSIERVELRGAARGSLWGHVALDAGGSADVLNGTLALYADDGTPVMRADGVLVRRAPRALFLRHQVERAPEYEIVWKPAPRASGADRAGRWLLLAGESALSRQLADVIAAAGHSCLRVERGSVLALAPERASLDSGDGQHYRELLDYAARDGVPVAGIVNLWGLDARAPAGDWTPETLLAAQRLACEPSLLLAQALNERPANATPSLTIVTRTAASSADGLAQSPVWGLRRVIALECPSLDCAIIDVDADDRATAEALFREASSRDGEHELGYRAGQRLAPRIALRSAAAPVAALSADATYIVTGGLGAIGLAIARWAVARGARTLVLGGRSAPTPEATAALTELRAAGAVVNVVAADVASTAGVEALLAAVPPHAPLRGIFHAAGVLDDAMLENQRWSRFETVFAPKVAGAWRLHAATRDLPLDYFVMFSSLASVLGSPSQANYAAANAFLDALAHHRRQLGLPALSVNWGPWAGAGMAAGSADEQQRRASRGVAPLDPATALAALEQLLASDACQVTVANVDWGKLAAVTASAFSPDFARDVLPRQAGSSRSDARPDLRAQLQSVPPERRRAVLLAHVQAEVAHVIGVDDLAAAQSPLTFMEMGMNSLMVVELRNNLEATVGCKVPATVIFNYPTIDGLADYIGRELGVAASEPSAPSAAVDNTQAAAAARIAQLSDSEVETLLLRTLEDIK